MTVEAFLDWAMRQPLGRCELVAGQVIAMVPEPAMHNLAKARAYKALDAPLPVR